MSNTLASNLKWQLVRARMASLGLHEADIEEKFIRGSGAGGQKINKTSIAVQIKHLPSGIEVRCQESRSQQLNRFIARRRLVEKFEALIGARESERKGAIEKIRRQKRKRSKRAKEKMLENKQKTSQKKQNRRKPGLGE